MTLVELHDVMGDRIKTTLKNDVTPEEPLLKMNRQKSLLALQNR